MSDTLGIRFQAYSFIESPAGHYVSLWLDCAQTQISVKMLVVPSRFRTPLRAGPIQESTLETSVQFEDLWLACLVFIRTSVYYETVVLFIQYFPRSLRLPPFNVATFIFILYRGFIIIG